jgi:hypothetical protein
MFITNLAIERGPHIVNVSKGALAPNNQTFSGGWIIAIFPDALKQTAARLPTPWTAVAQRRLIHTDIYRLADWLVNIQYNSVKKLVII